MELRDNWEEYVKIRKKTLNMVTKEDLMMIIIHKEIEELEGVINKNETKNKEYKKTC